VSEQAAKLLAKLNSNCTEFKHYVRLWRRFHWYWVELPC